MSAAPPNILLPILLAQFATERILVDSFLDRASALHASLTAQDAGPMSATDNRAALADLLFEAIAALEDHASEEEAFLKKLASTLDPPIQYESHIEDHASLAEAMSAIVEAYANDDAVDCACRLHDVLARWRYEHIDRYDMPLLEWINPD